MKYLLMIVLLLVGCSGQEIPKELQAEIDKTKKVAAKPVEVAKPAEPEKKSDEEVDPARLKTLEDKVGYIMDLLVKDVACTKKRKAAQPVLEACRERCKKDFPPSEEEPEDPPPALINGQCVQVKLAHPERNEADKKHEECDDGCWNELRDSTRCED